MKIILIPKLAFWPSLCLLLHTSYPSSASLVKAEEQKVKVTLEKPSFVSTGDIFALRVSLSGIHDGTNNKPKPDKEVEVEVELEHDTEVYLRNKLEFYGGNGRFLQRKVIQIGSINSSTSSVGVEFLIRAIATKQELVFYQVRVREMNQIIGYKYSSLTVDPPGIQWLLTNYRLIDFRKKRRMEVELFDKASYPAGLGDDEIYGRNIQFSLSPFHFPLEEFKWKHFNQLHYNTDEKDSVDIFDMGLQGLQNKLMQIEVYYLRERRIKKNLELPSHVKEDRNNSTRDLLRNLKPDIMFLMEFWNEEGGHFSGCSRNVSCREIEATAGVLKSLPLLNRWGNLGALVEGNKTELGLAANYLHKISYGAKDEVTMEQLLDISIALITFNDYSLDETEKLDLTPLINWLVASFDFTHKNSPLLNKFTFVLSKIEHSRAEEFLSKVEQNSKVSGENGRHWDNSVEGTAYALRSYLLQRKEMDSILPIVRWLVEKYYQNGEIHQPNPREVEIHH
jgi:hypothetical protein